MKILILGGTGMLGHMACRTFPSRFETFAVSKRPLDDDNPMLAFLPKRACFGGVDALEDKQRLHGILGEVKPDVVLNCVGIIKQKKEAHDAIPSIRTNALFPHELAELATRHRAKAIFFSTDCVFSGQSHGSLVGQSPPSPSGRGPEPVRYRRYVETDIPDPVDLYGRSKLLGEVSEPPHLTIRSSIIGRELGTTSSGLIEWFISQRGKAIQGYAKAIYTGFTTSAMCRLIMDLLEKRFDLSGIHHIASAPISKYDLLTRLNGPLGLGITISKNEAFECDRSLDGTRFEQQTGLAIPTWDEMLRELVEDARNYDGWRR